MSVMCHDAVPCSCRVRSVLSRACSKARSPESVRRPVGSMSLPIEPAEGKGVRVSRRVGAIAESATVAVDAKAKALKAAGEDVIGFGAGEPDFPTPPHVVAAAQAACRVLRYQHYTPTAGLPELREAIAAKTARDSGYQVAPSQVLVTNGGKQAIYEAFAALLDPDDEVLVPSPYWVTYPEAIALAGGVPVAVPTTEASGFRATVAQLEAARTPRTKVLLFVSPSNPTGAVYPPEEVEAIGRWAAQRGLWVITDEIYEHLVYGDNQFSSMPALVPALAERCVVVNGVAKSYAMTGWRVGWLIGPPDVVKAAINLQSHLTTNVANVSQAAALAAVAGDLEAVPAKRSARRATRACRTPSATTIWWRASPASPSCSADAAPRAASIGSGGVASGVTAGVVERHCDGDLVAAVGGDGKGEATRRRRWRGLEARLVDMQERLAADGDADATVLGAGVVGGIPVAKAVDRPGWDVLGASGGQRREAQVEPAGPDLQREQHQPHAPFDLQLAADRHHADKGRRPPAPHCREAHADHRTGLRGGGARLPWTSLLPRLVGEELDDRLPRPRAADAEFGEHLGADALAFADEAEEQMLGTDVVVVELQRLAQRQLHDLLGTRRKGDVPARLVLTGFDHRLDLVADHLQGHAEALERPRDHALPLMDQPEEQMLGTDVVVLEEACLLLGEDDRPASGLGEAFEHGGGPLCDEASTLVGVGGVALDGEIDQLCDEVRIAHPRGSPQHREHAPRGEPGDGVHLVDQHAAAGLLVEEIDSGKARAVERPKCMQRERPHPLGDGVGDRRGDHQAGGIVEVLRLEVVELVAGDDLADHAGLGGLVAEHAALQLARVQSLFHHHLGVVGEGCLQAVAERLGCLHLGDADRRAKPGRLGEHRVGELPADTRVDRVGVGAPLALTDHQVGGLLDAGGGEHHLGHGLVHRQRRGEHAAADVGQAGELEQPLHGAVLAVGAVQQREDHVDRFQIHSRAAEAKRSDGGGVALRAQRHGGAGRLDLGQLALWGGQLQWRPGRQHPGAVAGDTDRDHLEALRVERFGHRSGRDHRDRVLGRKAPIQQRQADPPLRHSYATSRAWEKSSQRSSASSRPTETRTMPAPMPAAARVAASSCRWVVEAGCATSVSVPPREGARRATRVASMKRRPAARPPARSKERKPP